MLPKDLRIVFMGTPEFAVGSLEALVCAGLNVVAVVTMPDKPAGRGHKIQFSPVKQFALDHNLPLLQPARLKDPEFVSQLEAFKADLQIVVAFRMLPEVVWNMPRFGTFNLHASLLPQYRGAAPINWAVINGDTETGVTTFMLTHEIDTGSVILQQKLPIRPEDNVGVVYDKLMAVGSRLVVETVNLIAEGKAELKPQIETPDLRPAPKIFKDICHIDFSRKAVEVHNLVRGLSPYPCAWFSVRLAPNSEPVSVKVFESSVEPFENPLPAGTVVTDGKKCLKVACSDGLLNLLSLQLSGKRRMAVRDLLCGTDFGNATIVS